MWQIIGCHGNSGSRLAQIGPGLYFSVITGSYYTRHHLASGLQIHAQEIEREGSLCIRMFGTLFRTSEIPNACDHVM